MQSLHCMSAVLKSEKLHVCIFFHQMWMSAAATIAVSTAVRTWWEVTAVAVHRVTSSTTSGTSAWVSSTDINVHGIICSVEKDYIRPPPQAFTICNSVSTAVLLLLVIVFSVWFPSLLEAVALLVWAKHRNKRLFFTAAILAPEE